MGPALDNTATTTYTFTPDAGQCAATATLTITVNNNTVPPTFAAIAPICSGATLAALPRLHPLKASPVPGLRLLTTLQPQLYTFTPDEGQCATTATLTITITDNITPDIYSWSDPYCTEQPSRLFPTTSNNGITGTWNPAINNTATTTYTFTPDDGHCATTAT